MEQWILYGTIAAILIACRDIFTRSFTKRYTITEHLLYYYVLCGLFILAIVCYRSYYLKENIKMIYSEDIWKYALIAFISVLIISPCQTLSLKYCKNPGQSKAIVNLNTLFVFILSFFFLHKMKFSFKHLIGILITGLGIYLIV